MRPSILTCDGATTVRAEHVQVGCRGAPAAPLDARRRCTPHRQTAVCRLLSLMSGSDAAARTHWEATEPQAGSLPHVLHTLALSAKPESPCHPEVPCWTQTEKRANDEIVTSGLIRPPVSTLAALLHAADPMLDPRLVPLPPCPPVELGHE
ncbi:hypothetical protein HDV57DRAFT_41171 [Trichoderma longibrachiatum]